MQLAVSTRYKLTFLFGVLILSGLLLAVLGSTGQKISSLRTAGALLFGVGAVAETVYLCLYCVSCYHRANAGESTTETSTSAYYERRFALERAQAECTDNSTTQTSVEVEQCGRVQELQNSGQAEPGSAPYEELAMSRHVAYPSQDMTGCAPDCNDSYTQQSQVPTTIPCTQVNQELSLGSETENMTPAKGHEDARKSCEDPGGPPTSKMTSTTGLQQD